MIHTTTRALLALTLAAGTLLLGPATRTARAGLVPTAEVLSSAPLARAARARVEVFLQRADVVRQLEALGVDVEEARSRAAALSDAEIAQIDQRLAQLPAGGDAGTVLIVIVAVLSVVAIILVFTELSGYTDVFWF